jgi:short-subunit dehydrogenase
MKNMYRTETVVVTGGTAGVGRATVRMFAEKGANICVIARGKERLENTRKEVESLGGKAIVVSVDVADADAIENAAEQTEHAFGPIDIWVNNAMTSVFAPFHKIAIEEFKRVTDVTYHGYVNGTMAALKRMRRRDRGTIVQVGSALAYRSIPLQSAYCGAKHAIVGFTDSVRSELLHDKSNVHITVVHLPALNTPQFDWVRSKLDCKAQPVPPIFQPEVAADAIFWAAHHKRRELRVGWPSVEGIWAQKIAPGIADRYLADTNYDAQQTDQPEDPNRADYLFQPVRGDFKAHGRFDQRARPYSIQLWLTKHKYPIYLGLAAAGIAGIVGNLAGRKNGKISISGREAGPYTPPAEKAREEGKTGAPYQGLGSLD